MNTQITQNTPPALGEYWQGQGGIFVGLGRGRDGGRDYHLIVPTDPRTTLASRMLGTYGVDVSGAGSMHNGPANTAALALAGSEVCQEIQALEIDGHKDFYLLCPADGWLCMATVPELFTKEWHITSTQYSSSHAYIQHFDDGDTDDILKNFKGVARAVRRSFL